VDQQDRFTGTMVHLLGLGWLLIPYVGNIVGPLILWLIKRGNSGEGSMFIDEQGKEAVNFQISVTIYAIAATLLIVVGVGIILTPFIFFADAVFVIIAAVKANRGDLYRYPLTMRFIR
jgi:uncharacterized Tic20 family protein